MLSVFKQTRPNEGHHGEIRIMAKQVQTETVAAPETAAPARRRGRPATFPDQEVVPFLTNIPAETREMVREVAQRRTEAARKKNPAASAVTLNAVVDGFIRSGYKAATRTRKSS